MSEATSHVAALAPATQIRSRASDTIQHSRPAAQFGTSLATTIESDQTSSSIHTQHTVQRGDSLSRIARNFLRAQGLQPSICKIYDAVRVVAKSNRIENANLISPGQKIDLCALSTQRTSAEAATNQGVMQPTVASAGTRSERASVVARSGMTLSISSGVSCGQSPSSFVAHNRGDVVAQAIRILSPSRGSRWARTLDGPARLSSPFGARRDPFTGRQRFHGGIDLAAGAGTEIRPFQSGVVTFSGRQSGFGNVVKVLHANGLESTYGHNSVNLVSTGDTVDKATPLGWVGATGRATGPHLHFEIRRDGEPVNPLPFLNGGV